jgi:hypothetical protein
MYTDFILPDQWGTDHTLEDVVLNGQIKSIFETLADTL